MIFKEAINSLDIKKIRGNVRIEPNEHSVLEVISTDEDLLNISIERQTLVISGKIKDNPKNDNSINYNNSKYFFGNNVIINNTVINGVSTNDYPEVDITIKVPVNTLKNIKIAIAGELIIDEISEHIRINSSGQTNLKVKNINRLDIDISGQSNSIIEETTNLTLDISGQSHMTIFNSKKIEDLNANISGMSNVTVKSDIQDLYVDVSGMVNFNIYGKVASKRINKSGMSNVNLL